MNNVANPIPDTIAARAMGNQLPINFPMPMPVLIPGRANPYGDSSTPFASSIFALPTPDLMGISPEMLTAYFRPVQLGTNVPAFNGPFHVSFLSPLPPGLPDHSSHAEYIVK